MWNIFDNLSWDETLFLQTVKLILDKSSAKIWTELALIGLMDQLILQSQLNSNFKFQLPVGMNPRFLTSFTTNYDVTMSPPSVCVLATASDDWLRDLTLSITKCPTLGIDIRKTWFCLLNRYTYILKTCKSRHCLIHVQSLNKSTPFHTPFH